MDKYFNSYREMISLRGLTDHTLSAYCTYIHAYLDYLENILHKQPEEVTWDDLRDFIRWLSKNRNLSARTINCAISQLRFLPCMSFINPGMLPSSRSVSLTLIFPLSLQEKRLPAIFLMSLI